MKSNDKPLTIEDIYAARDFLQKNAVPVPKYFTCGHTGHIIYGRLYGIDCCENCFKEFTKAIEDET